MTFSGNYGMTFGNGGHGQSSGSGGSPFNQGMDLAKTPFSSSIDAMGTSLGGGGMGEVSGVGMGGMRNGLMSVPGMFLHGPSKSRGHVACLRDDVICPTYCLVIDEFGCKSCPCGPGTVGFLYKFRYVLFNCLGRGTQNKTEKLPSSYCL